ncbi:MAG TPA: chorismate pyruvate-lyase family protein, partial [Nitrospiria bacterium]
MPDLSPAVMPWMSGEAFLNSDAAARMGPILRLLLTSDGTITTALRAFRLAPITVEVVRQEMAPLDTDTARFLEVEAGLPVLSRRARLVSAGNVLLSADSSILLEGLPLGLRQARKIRPNFIVQHMLVKPRQ